jgi:hypothetical protein
LKGWVFQFRGKVSRDDRGVSKRVSGDLKAGNFMRQGRESAIFSIKNESHP